MSNIIEFPSTERQQLERLAKRLGAVIVWPTRRKTARDCILEVLGSRVALTTAQIAAASNVSYSHTQALLTILRRDGIVIRQKSRVYGGWLLAESLEQAA